MAELWEYCIERCGEIVVETKLIAARSRQEAAFKAGAKEADGSKLDECEIHLRPFRESRTKDC